MHNLNTQIFNFINSGAIYYPYLEKTMLFLTHYLAYTVSIGVGFYILMIYPLKTKSFQNFKKAWRQGFELVVSIISVYVIVSILKAIIAQPRPFLVLNHINALIPNETGYSFPSGHASMTAAIATTVYFYHPRLGVLLYLFALVVGVSRIFVGVHYPVDVIGGFIVGVAIPLLIHFILYHSKNHFFEKTPN